MLQYICKVYLKFFEQSGSEDKYCQREYPEIKCQYRVVPDRHFVYQGVTIPLDNIKQRIQFEYFLKDPAKPEIIEVTQTPTCRAMLMIWLKSRKNTTAALVI